MGTERRHIMSVLEGAADDCITDSPLNIVAQTHAVNCPRISDFERYRFENCQGMEVIDEIVDGGYIRVRVPDAGIDVTYNPLSTIAPFDWPSDWYNPKKYFKRTWN